MDSILDSTKKILGLAPEYDVFDVDIITHINTAFFTLNQLGIGPAEGFSILDRTSTWAWFTEGRANLNSVKTYVYLRVRLLFDPPQTSFAISAMEKQIQELEWRLNVNREGVTYPWIPTTSTA